MMSDDGSRILPRPLRLSIRFAKRFASGGVAMPKYLGVTLAIGFLPSISPATSARRKPKFWQHLALMRIRRL
jgi:hypothetical protein